MSEEKGLDTLREPTEEFVAWLEAGAAEGSVLSELSWQGFLVEEEPKRMAKKTLKANAQAALDAFPDSRAIAAHVEWALMMAKGRK